ncbi:MAG TPA: RNA polymerase sigma factor [Thermoanaerobaculia bacterium]|nr:RNA polymerase sigma factor [Thermoanaerobaculia bacterium]
MDLEKLSDEELVEKARTQPALASECLGILYRRFYPKVAYWCLRVCGSREEAADLAQEVFLRVHSRLGSFRGESRFSTWLYQVTRSVAINRGESNRRRTAPLTELEAAPEVADPLPDAQEVLARAEAAGELRAAMEELEPLEARVLYLHFANGLTLPCITELLRLENRSGAKAFIVSATRKLRRRFGLVKEVSRAAE